MQNPTSTKKRIVKNTLMLYIRMGVLILINLYTSRIILNALGAEDFGLYSIVGSVIVFLGFLNGSMTAASQRFLSYAKGRGDAQEESRVFNSLIITHLIIALIIVTMAETAGIFYINHYLKVAASRLTAAHIVYQFSLGCLLCKTLTVPYNAAVVSNEKMDAFALISIIEGMLQLGVALLLPWVATDKLILYAGLMFAVVFTTQLCYRIYSSTRFPECRLRKNWQRSKIREILTYSGWNFLGAFSSVIISQGINMVLNFYFGVVINAARGITSQVNGALASFMNNFVQALNPQIVKTYAAKEYGQMHHYLIIGTRLSFFLMLVLAVPFLFNMEDILHLWLVNVPAYTPWLCRLELIYSLISTFSASLLIGVMATKDIKKYQIVLSTINVMTLPLSVIALQIYRNPYIASVVMCIVALVAFTARLIIAKQQIYLARRMFLFSLMRSVAPTVLVLLPTEYYVLSLLPQGGLVMVATRVLVSFLLCIIAVWLLGAKAAERKRVISFAQHKLHI